MRPQPHHHGQPARNHHRGLRQSRTIGSMESNGPREPEEVFTPRTVVSREMFTRRNEPDLYENPGLQDSLVEAIRERGAQILVFGDTGVGKSSLVRYAAEDGETSMLTVECRSRRSFDDHCEDGLRQLIDFEEVEVVDERTTAREGEAGVSKIITLKGTLRREDGTTSRFEAIRRTPLDALLQAMEDNRIQLLVFDNFQNVDERERSRFGEAMELMSDRASATDNIKVIVVGIAEDASSLLGSSGSIRRRTVELGVPRMPDDEIREIFATGFRLLGIRADGRALAALVFYSDGFPYFAHLLGLNAARVMRRRDESLVQEGIVEGALKRAAAEVEQTFEPRVRIAFEAGGDVRPRRRILEVMAYSGSRELLSSEIVSEYENRFGGVSDPGFLQAALGQLIQEKYGSTLARRGPRGRFMYRFSDPRMRPYLRIAHFPVQLALFG